MPDPLLVLPTSNVCFKLFSGLHHHSGNLLPWVDDLSKGALASSSAMATSDELEVRSRDSSEEAPSLAGSWSSTVELFSAAVEV